MSLQKSKGDKRLKASDDKFSCNSKVFLNPTCLGCARLTNRYCLDGLEPKFNITDKFIAFHFETFDFFVYFGTPQMAS